MAKKRVHEIAKERGIPSKEVLAVLQKAGFEVKAAASSVDEADVERAFAADGGSNGADVGVAVGRSGSSPTCRSRPSPRLRSRSRPPRSRPARRSRRWPSRSDSP